MKVAAKYGGGAKYYPGVITRDNGDGTYAIKYDDGDTEDAVKRPLIRTEEPIWSEGHSVEVREAGTGRYLLGVVTRHNRGTFDVDFGDGRIERRVGPERMREPPARERGPEGVGGEEGAASCLSEVDSPSAAALEEPLNLPGTVHKLKPFFSAEVQSIAGFKPALEQMEVETYGAVKTGALHLRVRSLSLEIGL